MSRAQKELLEQINKYFNGRSDTYSTYVEGPVCSGKTRIITDVLDQMNVSVIKFLGGATNGRKIVDCILPSVISKCDVHSLMTGSPKNLIVWIDDVAAMLSSDKAGLGRLVKFLKSLRKPAFYIIFSGRVCEDKRLIVLRSICHHVFIGKPYSAQASISLSWRYMHVKNLAMVLMRKDCLEFVDPRVDIGVTSLTWHENVGVALDSVKKQPRLQSYKQCLNRLAVTDQISKTLLTSKLPVSNSHLLKISCHLPQSSTFVLPTPFNFTKAITKFSTFHNNRVFRCKIAQQLNVRYDEVFEVDNEEVLAILNKKDYERWLKFRSRSRNGLARLP